MWPAVAWLAVFVWLELVHPDRAEPAVVAVFLAAYALVTILAALVFGSAWFERGDGFEVYSTLLAHLAPLGRRADGRLVVRNPLDGLAALRAGPGTVALVVLLVGSTAFDGVTRTRLWSDGVRPDDVVAGTIGLVAAVVVIALAYVGAARLVAVLGRGGEPRSMPGLFAHSVVPIALGYTVAHYFSLFVLDGQLTFILAADPFGTGAITFGSDRSVDYNAVSPETIALVQVGAIVAGHVVGVVSAHDRAVSLYRGGAATRSQYPLVAVMIAFTLAGVALLLGA